MREFRRNIFCGSATYYHIHILEELLHFVQEYTCKNVYFIDYNNKILEIT